jgi:hypothetical protein
LAKAASTFKMQCLHIIAELMQVDSSGTAGDDLYVIAGDFNLPKLAVANTIETVVRSGFEVWRGEARLRH